MTDVLNLLLNVLKIGLPVGAAVFSVIALRRFTKGEFYNIIKWITYSYVLIAIYKIIETSSELMTMPEETTNILENVFFIGAMLFVFRAAYLIYKFSETYGFRRSSKNEK